MSLQSWLITIVFALAILITWGLIAFARRFFKPEPSEPSVRIWGAYSPIATWLKYRKLPSYTPPSFKLPTLNLSALGHAFSSIGRRVFGQLNSSKLVALEWLVILVVGVYLGRSLYNADPLVWPRGNEAPIFLGLNQAILQDITPGQFPLWQHTISLGYPVLANPDITLFNPFVMLFSLLGGVANGMKWSLAVGLFWAGWGAWLLGWALGLRPAGRLWCAGVYMASGTMVNIFDSGIYALGLGAAWMPWVFAAFVLVFKTDWKWPKLLGIAALAALVLSGHVYYAGFTLGGIAVMCLVWALQAPNGEVWRTRLQWKKWLVVGAMVAAAGGLAAFTLIPQAEIRSWLAYDNSGPSSVDWRYALLNYVVDNQDYYGARLTSPGGHPLESYHYIGRAAALLLILLVPAFQRKRWRELTFLAGLVVLGLAWAAQAQWLIDNVGKYFPLLTWFRYPFRALVLGTIGLSGLSGYCLDYLMALFDRWHETFGQALALILSEGRRFYIPFVRAAQGVVLALLLFSFGHYLETNGGFIGANPLGQDVLEQRYLLMKIKSKLGDTQDYLVNYGGSSLYYVWNLRLIWAGADLGALPFSVQSQPDDVSLPTNPQFDLRNKADAVPPDYKLFLDTGLGPSNLYWVTSALPYAFEVDLKKLKGVDPSQYMGAGLVTAVPAKWQGPNMVWLKAESRGGERLVVSARYFNGWKVWIDGQQGTVLRTAEYISVDTLPGAHLYRFVFQPLTPILGLVISILSLMGVAVYGFFPRRGLVKA